jgi:hypothetical protein
MERMFALTSVGEFISERLDGRRSLNDIRDEVVAAFNVEEDQADSDIQEFLAELISAELVQEVLP